MQEGSWLAPAVGQWNICVLMLENLEKKKKKQGPNRFPVCLNRLQLWFGIKLTFVWKKKPSQLKRINNNLRFVNPHCRFNYRFFSSFVQIN